MKFPVLAAVATLALSACGSPDQGPDQPDGADADAPAAVVPVPAGGYFELPAGLWERKVIPMTGKAPPVERVCLDDSVRARVIPLTEARGLLADCKLIEQSERSMFGVTFRLQCSKPKATEVGGNTAFKDGVLTTGLNIVAGGTGADDPLPSNASARTTRVGDCPSNMKPGDIADPSGKVIGTLGG